MILKLQHERQKCQFFFFKNSELHKLAVGDHNIQTRRRRDFYGAVGKPPVATGLIINFFLNVTRHLI